MHAKELAPMKGPVSTVATLIRSKKARGISGDSGYIIENETVVAAAIMMQRKSANHGEERIFCMDAFTICATVLKCKKETFVRLMV